MAGLGTVVNVMAILLGGTIGLVLRGYLSKRIMETVMQGVGLAIIIIGIGGALSASFKIVDTGVTTDYILLMILSLVTGAFIGEWIRIEDRLDSFAKLCERKFTKPDENSDFAKGFVSTSLIYCVGAMAIVGSLEDGINGNSDILFAKSALDGITAIIFASTLGVGVLFSAISVGIYQGLITVLSMSLASFLNDTLISQMSLIGSVLIMSIGFNMLKVTSIKTGNLLPAVFIPIFYHLALMIIRSSG